MLYLKLERKQKTEKGSRWKKVSSTFKYCSCMGGKFDMGSGWSEQDLQAGSQTTIFLVKIATVVRKTVYNVSLPMTTAAFMCCCYIYKKITAVLASFCPRALRRINSKRCGSFDYLNCCSYASRNEATHMGCRRLLNGGNLACIAGGEEEHYLWRRRCWSWSWGWWSSQWTWAGRQRPVWGRCWTAPLRLGSPKRTKQETL